MTSELLSGHLDPIAHPPIHSLEVPVGVNPVTGAQWGEREPSVQMSDDEKEAAAEELMGLIDRLNRTGIIRLDMPAKPKSEE